MSKPSSHDNNLSNSSHFDESEVPTEQRAIALLPQSYSFELTDEFRAAFTKDATAGLPSSYKLAFWKKYIGDPAHAKELAEVDEANRQAMAEYEAKVAEVEKENQRISLANSLAERQYEIELEAYRRDLDRYLQACNSVEQYDSLAFRHRSDELFSAIYQHNDFVKAAIEDAFRIAKERWKRQSFFARLSHKNFRHLLADTLNNYGNSTTEDKQLQPRYKFFLSSVTQFDEERKELYSPTETTHTEELLENPDASKVKKYAVKEPTPLGTYKAELFEYVWGFKPVQEILLSEVSVIQGGRKRRLMKILKENTRELSARLVLHRQYKDQLPELIVSRPEVPVKPILEESVSRPSPPKLRTPYVLQPPPDCFDTPDKGLVEHVFKGSQVYGLEEVMTLARTRLYADDLVRPHFTFGGAPFPIQGNSPHMLIVGTTGSGKTTTMLRLMSSLLPLSTSQANRLAERLANGAPAYPESLHQWGRSRTHQAVVYNAKGEYLQYLEAFGFDSEIDLFNLDPADPNGYAWDVAADIDTRDSIKKFAEQLIPKSVAASQDKQAEFWNSTARAVVEAIIVSLRNAARHVGKEPSWTLRDLVKIGRNDDYIKLVLRWHDTPLEVIEEFFGLEAQQTSSVMLTLRQCMREYDLVAECWHHAKSRGRAISLKKWSLEGRQSVVVLPDTMENVSSHGPLNKAVMKALAGIWLKDRYSFYIDQNGSQQKRHRFVIIDEFGEAGQFDELKRIMSQGRTFGIHVVLGLHQLSQVREVYGENGSETIIGLCPYKACLKSDDTRTQKWMSELIGTCLRSYEKNSFTYSTSDGVTITQSTNESDGGSRGTNESTSNSSTKGTSDTTGSSESHTDSKQQSSTSASKSGERGTSTTGSGTSDTQGTNRSHTDNVSATEGTTSGTSEQTNWSSSTGYSKAVNKAVNKGASTTRELRGEAAIEPHEFGRFPDPETSGECEGVYITPTLPVFRTKLRAAQVQPEFEYPEKLNKTSIQRSPQEDEMVSKPTEWTNNDLVRLFLDKPHTLPEIPHILTPTFNLPVVEPSRSRAEEQPLLEPLDDNEPPLADFEF